MSNYGSPQDQVDALLKQSGARHLRQGKHHVWLLPNGKNFIQAKTASDYRSAANDLSKLRKLLGPQFDYKKKTIRELARETIGSPRPTVRKTRRKGGASRTVLDPELNRHAPVIHLSDGADRHTEGGPRLSTVQQLHMR